MLSGVLGPTRQTGFRAAGVGATLVGVGVRGLLIGCWLLGACRWGFDAVGTDGPDQNCQFRDLAAGARDACAVNSRGELWCWGYLAGPTPQRIDVGAAVQRVAIGHDAVYVLREDAKVRVFGSGGKGELGTGIARDELDPVPLLGDPDVRFIGGGRSFACMVTVEGKLACWGREYDGELGNSAPSDSEQLQPTELPILGAPIDGLAIGGFSACVTLADQTARCWGAVANASSSSGVNSPTPWDAAGTPALGLRFHCQLRDGVVECLGRGEDGQLGDGNAANTTRQAASVLRGVVEIDSGSRSTCAVKADGTLWCWGPNRSGELGVGDVGVRLVPTQVGLEGVRRVSIGFATTCAEAAGQVYCWGNNNQDQLGRNTGGVVRTPTAISELPAIPFVEVDVGGTFGCGRTASGEVWCWGQNRRGQLGSGGGDAPSAARMVPLPFAATEIALGDEHACALGAGTMRCWGNNDDGQLGTSLKTRSEPPIQPVLPGGAVTAVIARDSATCAVVAGQLYCWGRLLSPLPTLVAGLPAGVTTAAAVSINRNFHQCAVSGTGTDCWGDNSSGQLGNGTTVDSATR